MLCIRKKRVKRKYENNQIRSINEIFLPIKHSRLHTPLITDFLLHIIKRQNFANTQERERRKVNEKFIVKSFAAQQKKYINFRRRLRLKTLHKYIGGWKSFFYLLNLQSIEKYIKSSQKPGEGKNKNYLGLRRREIKSLSSRAIKRRKTSSNDGHKKPKNRL